MLEFLGVIIRNPKKNQCITSKSVTRLTHFLTLFYRNLTHFCVNFVVRTIREVCDGKAANQLNPDVIEWIGRIYEMWNRFTGLSSKEVYQKTRLFRYVPSLVQGTLRRRVQRVQNLAEHWELFKTKENQNHRLSEQRPITWT